MSADQPTFYEILGVPPTVKSGDILVVYKEITNETKTELPVLGKLAAESAKKRMRNVEKAKDVLLEDLRELYDEKIGLKAKCARRSESSQRQTRKDTSQTSNPGASSSYKRQRRDATPPEAGPLRSEAASRHMETGTGTIVDVSISGWRLQLHLSTKFRFLEDMTELSDKLDNKTIWFKIDLAYNSASRESFGATSNELVIKIKHLPSWIDATPGSKCGIVRFQTIFAEPIFDMSTLTISITAGARSGIMPDFPSESRVPWEFGFDFSLGWDAVSHRRGKCLIFSIAQPPLLPDFYDDMDSPGFALMRDPSTKASHFMNLQGGRAMKIRYDDVEMWRLAAVGWKA